MKPEASKQGLTDNNLIREIRSEPLIGWGNRHKEDTACEISLLMRNPLARFGATPTQGFSQHKAHLWWDTNGTQAGISVGVQSIIWNPSEIQGYIIDIGYPSEFSGVCGFGLLPQTLVSRTRADKFLCVQMPYSSASLEILLRISATLSSFSSRPVTMIQWSDSRA